MGPRGTGMGTGARARGGTYASAAHGCLRVVCHNAGLRPRHDHVLATHLPAFRQVEVADVEEKAMQVLYQDEAGVHVMDRCGGREGGIGIRIKVGVHAKGCSIILFTVDLCCCHFCRLGCMQRSPEACVPKFDLCSLLVTCCPALLYSQLHL